MIRAHRSAKELPGSTFERILLIKPSSLGDIIHALPVLRGLRIRFPSARIDWLVASVHAPLIQHHPNLTGIVIFDRRRFGRMAVSPTAAWDFCRFVRGLRGRKYDIVIDLQGLFRTGFLAYSSGASVRIGFADAREGAGRFYTHRIPATRRDAHAIDRNYAIAELLGFRDLPIETHLHLRPADQNGAETLLRENGVDDGTPFVAIVPGARWETKRWSPQRFAEVIDGLSKQDGRRAILLGGPDEVELCREIQTACRATPINLAGKTTVAQMAVILGRSQLVLCHDSAALHMAVALERPLVCLVGPTNPRRTGPYRRLDDVVQLPLDCSPCYFRHLSQCPYHHRCMQELPVAKVLDALRDRLPRLLTT